MDNGFFTGMAHAKLQNNKVDYVKDCQTRI